jgi:hypothetical protein
MIAIRALDGTEVVVNEDAVTLSPARTPTISAVTPMCTVSIVECW